MSEHERKFQDRLEDAALLLGWRFWRLHEDLDDDEIRRAAAVYVERGDHSSGLATICLSLLEERTLLKQALSDLTPSPDGGYGPDNGAAWKDAYGARMRELAQARSERDRAELDRDHAMAAYVTMQRSNNGHKLRANAAEEVVRSQNESLIVAVVALASIIARCEEGDESIDWRPVVAGIARNAVTAIQENERKETTT